MNTADYQDPNAADFPNRTLPRSPELMSRDDTALLVIDVQEKLLPHVADYERLVWNMRRLIDAARLLDVPVLATEQYPRGLGSTVPELAERLDDVPDKVSFSCSGCDPFVEQLAECRARNVLLVGIETHVCVQQTAFDLQTAGYRVLLAVDAVGSRFAVDRDTALRRMEASGVSLTTTEAALFEWCESAAAEEFKAISTLVRETPPAE